MTPTSPMAPLTQLRRRRSAKWRTHPAEVLPLFVAEMDVQLAPPISETLRAAIELSDTGYAAPRSELPAAFAAFAARRWTWDVDVEQVSLAPDVSVAMVETLRVLLGGGSSGPADGTRGTVALSPPVYPPFYGWIREVGARTVEVPLREDDADGGAACAGTRLDLPALEAAFRAGVDVYMLCNPHNPVGTVHTRDELAALADLAARHGVTVVSDEIHAPLVLPGASFVPFLSVSAEARRCGVALESASKGWNLAGLKAAMIVTADRRTREIHGRFPAELAWRTGHLGVLASTAAFTAGEEWLDDVICVLDANRYLLSNLLREHLPRVRYRPPQASYLAWLDFRNVPAAAALSGPGDLAGDILHNCAVALSSGDDFGPPGAGHLRLNFGTSPDVLREAIQRLATYTPSEAVPGEATDDSR
ncbi:cystathione beta-lyase [Nocardioides terrae]|uniref:cysteine-S-conjugate beta-lyase n=1 Tax=Nocardioides terrae TaxID=574651 RepID=A0A1I1NST9_9ACTN|nr:aminotransferase class I/II-fold pyridoxal phosphate-dependent enzyme [Nocardioides terrae]SFC96790.1 cystathione beta-lyase [Nocardioides terrae]